MRFQLIGTEKLIGLWCWSELKVWAETFGDDLSLTQSSKLLFSDSTTSETHFFCCCPLEEGSTVCVEKLLSSFVPTWLAQPVWPALSWAQPLEASRVAPAPLLASRTGLCATLAWWTWALVKAFAPWRRSSVGWRLFSVRASWMCARVRWIFRAQWWIRDSLSGLSSGLGWSDVVGARQAMEACTKASRLSRSLRRSRSPPHSNPSRSRTSFPPPRRNHSRAFCWAILRESYLSTLRELVTWRASCWVIWTKVCWEFC